MVSTANLHPYNKGVENPLRASLLGGATPRGVSNATVNFTVAFDVAMIVTGAGCMSFCSPYREAGLVTGGT